MSFTHHEIPSISFVSGVLESDLHKDYVGKHGDIVVCKGGVDDGKTYIHDGKTPGGFLIEVPLPELVEKARLFAKAAYRASDLREPPHESFYGHLIRVVNTLTVHGVCDEVTVASAWLYDILTDKRFTAKDIEEEFGSSVKDLVVIFNEGYLSKNSTETQWDRYTPSAQSIHYAIMIDTINVIESNGALEPAIVKKMATSLTAMKDGKTSLKDEALTRLSSRSEE